MDYNATRKPELIKLLKESQKNETKLAVKASRLEKQLDDKKVEYQNYINNSETLDAELRAQIDDLENELKAERVRNRELSAKCDSLLVNSKGKYQSEMEELKRFINEEMEAEYCSQISHAVSDAENIIRRQQKELASFAAQIADLEKQLADVSQTETGAKVEGVFEVGDEVVYVGDSKHFAWKARGESTGTVLARDRSTMEVKFNCDASKCWPLKENLRHATPPAPTCPDCATKQQQIEELSRENEALNQTFEYARGLMGELEHRVVVERERGDELLADYDSFKTAMQDELGYANDNEPELIKELEVRIGRADELQTRIGDLSEQIEGLKSDVQAAEGHADQLTNICTNIADLISSNSDIAISDVYTMVKLLIKDHNSKIANHQTTIATHTATIADMSNHIALDKSSILRLTRELSAALLGGE
jgi:chromosome segregation ATPase